VDRKGHEGLENIQKVNFSLFLFISFNIALSTNYVGMTYWISYRKTEERKRTVDVQYKPRTSRTHYDNTTNIEVKQRKR